MSTIYARSRSKSPVYSQLKTTIPKTRVGLLSYKRSHYEGVLVVDRLEKPTEN